MKTLVTYYSTFFILTNYIALLVVPICYLLQKRNHISTKNSLAVIYALIASAVFISILQPQTLFLSELRDSILGETVSALFNNVRYQIWYILTAIFSKEKSVYEVLLITLSAVGTIGVLLYVSSIAVILSKIRKLKVYKVIGRVNLLLEDTNTTPHVFSFFRKSYIVIPTHVVKEKEILKTAINHEIQHIRNGDTHSIYLWQFFKCIMWINPAIHIILSHIKSLQELRVDESLIHEKKINYKLYLKTLSWFISESRSQPRYSLSHSIFGWSSFRELKVRIKNIHRVRPIRSQPLICLLLLFSNVGSLLIIGNSSPKFQYSLREIERMYLPEYMKSEFNLDVTIGHIDMFHHIHTLEFGREAGISMPYLSEKAKKAMKEYAKVENNSMVARLLFQINAKVIEYSDTSVKVKIDCSYADEDSLYGDPKKYKYVSFEKVLNLTYGEVFKVDHLDAQFKLEKKLVPKETISFFPGLDESIAANTEYINK